MDLRNFFTAFNGDEAFNSLKALNETLKQRNSRLILGLSLTGIFLVIITAYHLQQKKELKAQIKVLSEKNDLDPNMQSKFSDSKGTSSISSKDKSESAMKS